MTFDPRNIRIRNIFRKGIYYPKPLNHVLKHEKFFYIIRFEEKCLILCILAYFNKKRPYLTSQLLCIPLKLSRQDASLNHPNDYIRSGAKGN